MPSMDPMADDAFEFQYNFIRSGGVQLALNMLTKNNFLPNADLPTRRCVVLPIEIHERALDSESRGPGFHPHKGHHVVLELDTLTP